MNSRSVEVTPACQPASDGGVGTDTDECIPPSGTVPIVGTTSDLRRHPAAAEANRPAPPGSQFSRPLASFAAPTSSLRFALPSPAAAEANRPPRCRGGQPAGSAGLTFPGAARFARRTHISRGRSLRSPHRLRRCALLRQAPLPRRPTGRLRRAHISRGRSLRSPHRLRRCALLRQAPLPRRPTGHPAAAEANRPAPPGSHFPGPLASLAAPTSSLRFASPSPAAAEANRPAPPGSHFSGPLASLAAPTSSLRFASPSPAAAEANRPSRPERRILADFAARTA